MTFVELQFIIFLVLAVVAFYLFPVKYRWIALLLISLCFYAIAGIKYIPFIVFTSLTVYLAALKIGKIYEEQDQKLAESDFSRSEKKSMKEKIKARCKKVLLFALIINVMILVIVKFTKFLVEPINMLIAYLGGSGTFSAAFIIVPIGISYYTFSVLSYLLDVYWRRVDMEKNYFRFLLYAIYFPHILQGPIEHYGRLGQRLKAELRFDYNRMVSGMQLMIWGYFKKLVIAERLDIFITQVYDRAGDASGVLFLIAIFLDVVYIYADFSGYMDIARGVSELFGVELDQNFNHPFSARTVTDFWRRWHMTLGGWFREYVYMPISASQVVKNISKFSREHFSGDIARACVTALPVGVTWVLTGLWHGTGKTYLAWGIYYAILILCSVSFGESLHQLAVKLKINTEAKSYQWLQMIRTTCIFAGGRLLTRPGSLRRSWDIFKSVFSTYNPWALFDGSLYQYGLTVSDVVLVAAVILLFGIISHLQQQRSVRGMIQEQNLYLRWGICLLGIFSIIILGIYGPGYESSAFVYMAY